VLFPHREKEISRDGNKERKKGKMTASKGWIRGEKGIEREKTLVFSAEVNKKLQSLRCYILVRMPFTVNYSFLPSDYSVDRNCVSSSVKLRIQEGK
jgi:hypothetical protein